MEQYGNTSTYNVESVLQKNVVGSEYYNKTCVKLEDWGQVVDEIWSTVSDVEPWMSGNARGASTAFCLLFRSVRSAFVALNSAIAEDFPFFSLPEGNLCLWCCSSPPNTGNRSRWQVTAGLHPADCLR